VGGCPVQLPPPPGTPPKASAIPVQRAIDEGVQAGSSNVQQNRTAARRRRWLNDSVAADRYVT
jgi:hypothetical protein